METELKNKERYVNKHLSWIEDIIFNMQQAMSNGDYNEAYELSLSLEEYVVEVHRILRGM